MAEDFQVYAIRFAHRDASVRGEHFYGHAGDVVLAADASHFYENVEQETPCSRFRTARI